MKVMNKEPVDRPPFVCPGGMMTMVVTEVMDEIGCFWPEAQIDSEKMAQLTLGVHRIAGVENTGVPFCMTVEAEGMGATVILGSKKSEPRVTHYAIDQLVDADELPTFDADRGRAKVCVDTIKLLKERAPEVPVFANLTGPVSLATSLIEPLVYYRAIRRDKAAAHRLTELSTGAATAFGDAMLEAGADVVCIADPSATGEIIGRAAFEEFALPYINKLVEHFHERFGVPAIVHICGNVKSLGDALGAISAEVISVDSVVSITALKKQAEGKVSMGNISTYLLEQGYPAQVLKAGRNRIKGGINILAPACGISPRTPVANIRSLYEAAIHDGRPQGPSTRPTTDDRRPRKRLTTV